MIDDMRLKYPVPLLCRLFDVSSSGYYARLGRPLSQHARDDQRLEVEIMAAHKRTRETHGPERLQKELASYGVNAGICRIRRIRKKLGIICKQKKKFKATTNSRHNLPVADNLLEQRFDATAPNQVWVTDITYIPTEEGWLYLAGHKDIFTKEIVGYAMDARMTKELVSKSLLRAVVSHRHVKGLIHLVA
jgi:transposase InsO family protein